MTTSTSRKSYQDCFDLMEQAINSRGVRVQFSDEGAAKHCRLRIHKARVIDREENAVIFPSGAPEHGVSVYDPLVCRVKTIDGKCWLYIEKRSLDGMVVESLGDEEFQAVEDPKPIVPDVPLVNVKPKPYLRVEEVKRRL